MDDSLRYWFITSTTYGTWLPGDDRGFVSSCPQQDGTFALHNQSDTPFDKDRPDWRDQCLARLKGDPVHLSGVQAAAVVEQFRQTCRLRLWTLYIASVMHNHFHVLIAANYRVPSSSLLRDLKAYASRRLSQQWGKPAGNTWWTESGSRRPVVDERSFLSVYEYILNQPNCLAQWKRMLDNTVVIPRASYRNSS